MTRRERPQCYTHHTMRTDINGVGYCSDCRKAAEKEPTDRVLTATVLAQTEPSELQTTS